MSDRNNQTEAVQENNRKNSSFQAVMSVLFLLLLLPVCIALVIYGCIYSGVGDGRLTQEYIVMTRDFLVGNLLLIGLLIAVLFGRSLLGGVRMGKASTEMFEANISKEKNSFLRFFGTEKVFNRIMQISLVAVGIACIYWVFAANAQPDMDQKHICTCASMLNQGNNLPLQQGEYAAMYHMQLGLITYVRVLFALFGDGNYRAFQIINALLVPVIFYLIVKIVNCLSLGRRNSIKARYLALVLCLGCVPLYFYVPFVYGEIPSIAMLLWCGCLILKELNREDFLQRDVAAVDCTLGKKQNSRWEFIHQNRAVIISCYIGIFLSSFLAMLVRENSIIMLLGFLIVLMIKGIGEVILSYHNRNKGITDGKEMTSKDEEALRGRKRNGLQPLMICGIIVLAIFLESFSMKLLYQSRTPADSKGMPTVLHMAMGMQGERGEYNDYNRRTFEESDFDVMESKLRGKQALKGTFAEWKNSPKEMWLFFKNKITYQWSTPMYQSLAMTYVSGGDRKWIGMVVYGGALDKFFNWYMNAYQLVIYLLVLVYVVRSIFILRNGNTIGKKRDSKMTENVDGAEPEKWDRNNLGLGIMPLLYLVGIYGGFLFSIIWEAKPRYVFPYFIFLLIYAALSTNTEER